MSKSSEDVTVRINNGENKELAQRISDERIAKKIYDEKVSGKRGRGRPSKVSNILGKGHVKHDVQAGVNLFEDSKSI